MIDSTNHNTINCRLALRSNRDEFDDSSENEEEISHVEDHRTISSNLIQFLLFHRINVEKLWFDGKHCKDCIDMINSYYRKKEYRDELNPTAFMWSYSKSRTQHGTLEIGKRYTKNGRTYGKKSDLQSEIFRELENKDSIYLWQVESHCAVITFLADTETCIIAGGQNVYRQNQTTDW